MQQNHSEAKGLENVEVLHAPSGRGPPRLAGQLPSWLARGGPV